MGQTLVSVRCGRVKRSVRVAVGIAGLLLVLVAPGLLPAEAQFSIGTLNCEFLVHRKVHVRYGLSLDPRDWTEEERAEWETPGFRDARFGESVQAVAAVLQRMNADVLALCEVGNAADVQQLQTQLRALGLDYPHAAVGDSTDTFTGQHVAVLSRLPLAEIHTTIPGREFYDRELDDVETEDDTGISKGMRIVLDVDGQPLHLYVVHFSSERGGHEQDAQRIAQASIVRRSYLPLLQSDQHVVVAGDLNDDRGQPALRRIRGRDDIFDDLLQTAGPTAHARRHNETSEQYNERLREHWTYEFAGRRQQLDHLLISRSLKDACRRDGLVLRFQPIDVTVPSTGSPATDHRGVVLSFTFR